MINAIFTTAYYNFIQYIRSQIYLNILAGGLIMVLSAWIFSELVPAQSIETLVDIGLAFIPLLGAILAGSLGIISVSKEIENKSIHSYLATPMPRYVFVLANFVSLSTLVFLANCILGFVLVGLYLLQGGQNASFLYFAAMYILFESFIVVALTLVFAFASSSNSSLIFISLTFIMGRLLPAFAALIDNGKFGPIMSKILSFLYLILPQFFRFDLTPWVEDAGAPAAIDLLKNALYAVIYISALLTLAILRFRKRDLR